MLRNDATNVVFQFSFIDFINHGHNDVKQQTCNYNKKYCHSGGQFKSVNFWYCM